MHTPYCASIESNFPINSCASQCSHCNQSQISSISDDGNLYEESFASEKPSLKSLGDFPVDINEANTTLIDLPPLCWSRYNQPPKMLTVSNTGRTILINGQWTCSKPYIKGGPLSGSYIFSQIHFHCPSEHRLNGKRFPLEMHVVHYKTCYLTQERAMHEKDGTVVLVYLFKEAGSGKTVLSQVTNLMPFIETVHSKKEIPKLRLEQIVQPFTSNYCVYWGSVSTDKHSYLLQWIINCNHLYVTKQEVADMLNIMKSSGSFNSNRLARMRPENNAIFRVGVTESCESVLKSVSAESASKVFAIMSKIHNGENYGIEKPEKSKSKPRIVTIPPCTSTNLLKIKDGTETRKEKGCQMVSTINEATNTSPQTSEGQVQKKKNKKEKVSSHTQTDDTPISETSTIFHSEGGSYKSNTETREFFKDMPARNKSSRSEVKINKWRDSESTSLKSKYHDIFDSNTGSVAPKKSRSLVPVDQTKNKSKNNAKRVPSGSMKPVKSGFSSSIVSNKEPSDRGGWQIGENEWKDPEEPGGLESQGKRSHTKEKKVKYISDSQEGKSKGKKKKGNKSSDKAAKPCKPTKSKFFKSLRSAKICEPESPQSPRSLSSAEQRSRTLSDLKTIFKKKNDQKIDNLLSEEKVDNGKKIQVNYLMSPNSKLNKYSATVLTTESESLTQEKEICAESQEDTFSPVQVSMNNGTPSSSESLLNTTDMDVIDEPVNETTGNTNSMQVDKRAKENSKNELKELCLHMEHSFRSQNKEGSRSSFTCQEYYVAIEYDHNILQEYRGAFNPYNLVPGSSEKLTLVPKYKESKGLQIRLEDCAIKVESMDLVCVKAKFLLKKGSVQEMLNSNCFFKSAQEKLIKLFDAETQSTVQEYDLANLTNLTGIKLLEGKGDRQAGFKLSQGTQWEDLYAKENKEKVPKKQGDLTKKKSQVEIRKSGIRELKNESHESCKSSEGEESLELKRALVDRHQCKVKLLKNPESYRDENSETTSCDTVLQPLEQGGERSGGNFSLKKDVEAKRSVNKNKKTVYFMYDRIEKDAVTGKKVFVGSFRTKEEVEVPTTQNILLPEEQPGTPPEESEKSDSFETEKMTSSEIENCGFSEEVINIETQSTNKDATSESFDSNDVPQKDLITLHKFKSSFASGKSIMSGNKSVLIGRVVNRMQQEKGNIFNISEIFGSDKKAQGKISIRKSQDSSENNTSTAWSDSDNVTESENTRKTSVKTSTNIEFESSTCDESDAFFENAPKESEEKEELEESSENFGSSEHLPNSDSAPKDSQATIIIIPIEVESLSKIELILIEHSDDVTKEKEVKEYIPCLNCYKRSVFELKVYLFIFNREGNLKYGKNIVCPFIFLHERLLIISMPLNFYRGIHK